MKSFAISLKETYGLQGGELACYIGDCPLDAPTSEWKRPAVIVVPGGAYAWVSKREGEPIANFFQYKGFQTFALTYACCGDGVRYPEQLVELAASVDHIRKNAKNYHVNPDEIFVVGFSAGGHLAANLAVEYSIIREKTGINLDCKPTAVALCYPVISSECGHVESYHNLLRGYPEPEIERLSKHLNLDSMVTDQTPPTFIWTTAQDNGVPPENSLLFALALNRAKVLYELHIYPEGWHGLSACNQEICPPESYLQKNGKWMGDCASFFRLFTSTRF